MTGETTKLSNTSEIVNTAEQLHADAPAESLSLPDIQEKVELALNLLEESIKKLGQAGSAEDKQRILGLVLNGIRELPLHHIIAASDETSLRDFYDKVPAAEELGGGLGALVRDITDSQHGEPFDAEEIIIVDQLAKASDVAGDPSLKEQIAELIAEPAKKDASMHDLAENLNRSTRTKKSYTSIERMRKKPQKIAPGRISNELSDDPEVNARPIYKSPKSTELFAGKDIKNFQPQKELVYTEEDITEVLGMLAAQRLAETSFARYNATKLK